MSDQAVTANVLDSPPVTEQWCHDMGFRQVFRDPVITASGAREFLLQRDSICCIIGLEFNSDGCLLFVEDRISGECVILTNTPTQRDVESIDELVAR